MNELTLHWHAAVTSVGFEAFQAWGLASMRRRLPFDGALWAQLTSSASGPATQTTLRGAHLHRLPAAVLEQFEEARHIDLAAKRPLGDAVGIGIADARWHTANHAALLAHALDHRLLNTLSIHFDKAQTTGRQFLMLVRHGERDRFTSDEVTAFRLLAPHLMQAYANCRKLFLERSQPAGRRSDGVAVALVDSGGFVHDADPRFVPMLRREWSDWTGEQLPEAVLGLHARWSGKRWTFLGAQVSAEFAPVDNLYLVSVRPRHLSDVLTSREGEVAQRYASGESFREIADSLGLAPATVRSHLRNVFGKLQIRNKTQLAASLR